MRINTPRLAEVFVSLCEIDSPSRKEGRLATYLKKIFADLGADAIIEDDSAEQTGADCGNLLVRFNGVPEKEALFFNCHMDTVEPGVGVEVVRQGNIFRSKGKTVLGADDKSGIAALIEMIRICKENDLLHGTVELLFTTCEEVGLLGAKALDCSQLQAKTGYVLDTTGRNRVIIGAPASNRFVLEIGGMAAHAGLAPEQGINAIQLAASAIAGLKLGRLDHESTANIGLISGGTATNIIPDKAVVRGELRSHSTDKLATNTENIIRAFQKVVDGWTDDAGLATSRPSLSVAVEQDYPQMRIGRDRQIMKRIAHAAANLGVELEYTVADGGSDANIFNSRGLECVIVGTGMTKVHTTEEHIDLADLERTTKLVLAILAC